MKKALSILLALMLVLGMSAVAFADGTSAVTYEGGAEKYVFIYNDDFTDTDLFNNFKNVLPGDSIDQNITVGNIRAGNYYVNIYMKAKPHSDSADTYDDGKIHDTVVDYDENLQNSDPKVPTMEDFLHQLSMTIKIDDKVISQAPADELGGLSDWVLLGRFYKGDKKTITVTLEVPKDLGNEYAFRAGEVDWIFRAEEVPFTPDPGPKTGDDSNIVLYAGLMVGALTVLCVIFVFLRKRKSAE